MIITINPNQKNGMCAPVIGYESENLVTEIDFDYSDWAEEFGEGVMTLAVKRAPSDEDPTPQPYPLTLPTTDDHKAVWNITELETAIGGRGEVQWIYTVGEKVKKSAIYEVWVDRSLNSTGDMPDPYISYFEQIVAVGAQATQDAAAAAQSKTDAEQAAADAETAAQDARASADEIENMTATAETLPAGSDATAEYSDGTLTLGIPQGVPGNEGPQGPPGPTGNGIHSTVLNADYTLTITFTNGSKYTTPSIRGPQGPDGETGPTGKGIKSTVLNSDYTLTITFTDDTTYTTPSIRGEQGEQGDPGVVQDVTVNGTSVLDGAIAKVVIPEITKTVTDNPIVIDDADGEVKALNVELTPIQDLHGYDKPWAAGAGKNLANLAYGNQVPSVNTGQMVSASGWSCDFIPIDTSKTYTLSYVGTSTQYVMFYDASDGYLGYSSSFASGSQINASSYFSSCAKVKLRSDSAQGTNPLMQLEIGSTATSWQPYENICPISPHTSVDVRGTGKNLWGGLKMAQDIAAVTPNTSIDTTTKTVTYNAADISSKVLFSSFKANTSYTFFMKQATGSNHVNMYVRYTNGTNVHFPTSGILVTDADKTIECILGVWVSGRSILLYEECGVFEGVLTASDFVPYTGQTVTVPLNDLYGGTVGVTSGTGKEKNALITIHSSDITSITVDGNNTRVYTNLDFSMFPAYPQGLSNKFTVLTSWGAVAGDANAIALNGPSNGQIVVNKATGTTLADIRTALDGTELCFPLATPTDLSTTPTEITLYNGDNVVASDGNMELTYARNLQAVIDKIEAAL